MMWIFSVCIFQVFQIAYVIIKAANSPRPGMRSIIKMLFYQSHTAGSVNIFALIHFKERTVTNAQGSS